MLTTSILSYVNLNTPAPALCVINDEHSFNQISHYLKLSNLPVQAKLIQSYQVKSTHCNVLFFSQTSPAYEQQVINQSLNKKIVSFSQSNSECEIGSTFCLSVSKSGNSTFKVNLDSLAKSKVHVDPRVLLLAKNQE